jgi:ATP-dependent Clp protease ATP-binding subunit ClpX
VPPSKEEWLALVPSPKSVLAHLNQFTIGQEVAKRRLALAASNLLKRLVNTWVADDPIVTDADLRDVRIEKSSVLLIGPSGGRKTDLVRSLASYLNVHLDIGDATGLTETGYVGDNV